VSVFGQGADVGALENFKALVDGEAYDAAATFLIDLLEPGGTTAEQVIGRVFQPLLDTDYGLYSERISEALVGVVRAGGQVQFDIYAVPLMREEWRFFGEGLMARLKEEHDPETWEMYWFTPRSKLEDGHWAGIQRGRPDYAYRVLAEMASQDTPQAASQYLSLRSPEQRMSALEAIAALHFPDNQPLFRYFLGLDSRTQQDFLRLYPDILAYYPDLRI